MTKVNRIISNRLGLRWTAFLLVAILVLAVGCSGEDEPIGLSDADGVDVADQPDDPVEDPLEQEDQQTIPDGDDESPEVQNDPVQDGAEDIDQDSPQPPDFPLEPIVTPVPFRVGVAWGRLPAPVGIGTSGYGPAPGPSSPFASRYPATNRVIMPLEGKVIALEGGTHRLLLYSLDLIGISAEARHSLVDRLVQRTGLDLSDSIIISATHTHGGPGRLTTHPAYALAQDRFWPQFYERFIDFLAELAIQALAEMEAGRFGYTFLHSNDLGVDRRCETPEMMTGTLVLLRFDDAEGTPLAAALSYPIHGTVFDMTDFTLTADAAGGIRYKIQEGFDRPIPVLFFNSWGGDVAPAGLVSEEPVGIGRKQARCEALGNRAAELVIPAFDLIETTSEVEVSSLTADIELSLEAIGYLSDEWPYAYGAVYCGMNLPVPCYGEGDPPEPHDLVNTCLPLFEAWAITYTSIGIARIGDLAVAAFPGEPCTQVAQQVMEGIRQTGDLEEVMFIGYAQDYCGYSETYEYWWLGGYETSGAVWGPRQGDYISAELLALADHFFDPETPLSLHLADPPDPIIPADARVDYQTEPSLNPGTVIEDVPDSLELGQVVRFTFAGGDPWLGIPRIELESQQGGEWRSVLRHNGTVLANDSYEFEMQLNTVDPSYSEHLGYSSREFQWTAILPTQRSEPTINPPMVGTFRLKATGEALVGDEVVDFEVFSGTFQVTGGS